MNLPGGAEDVRAAWFAVSLAVIAGCFVVFRVDEGRIAAASSAYETVANETAHEQMRLREGPRIEASVQALRRAIHTLALDVGAGSVVALFVADAGQICARHRTRISSISSSAPTTQNRAVPADRTDPFEEIGLDVTVEGRYADVLATIRDLGEGRVLAGIEINSIARLAAAADPEVAASLHVALERLTAPQRPHGRAQPT